MGISVIWWLCLLSGTAYSLYAGTVSALTPALLEGVTAAVQFCLTAGGLMVFWCGVFHIAADAGWITRLSHRLSPLISLLFPTVRRNSAALSHICGNMAANLLGLGNAATPLGIAAAGALRGKDLARLVVLNTASIQLLPTTVAAVRSSLGSPAPLDILPCVLVTSLCSVAVGLLCVEVSFS